DPPPRRDDELAEEGLVDPRQDDADPALAAPRVRDEDAGERDLERPHVLGRDLHDGAPLLLGERREDPVADAERRVAPVVALLGLGERERELAHRLARDHGRRFDHLLSWRGGGAHAIVIAGKGHAATPDSLAERVARTRRALARGPRRRLRPDATDRT